MAKRFGSELVLLSAFQESVPPSEPDEVQWASSSSARTREILARAEEDLKRDGITCKLLVDQGDPAEVLVRLATECGADVLVIGNKGMRRRMLGSVPNTVSHKAPCSVFVVKTS